jgi:integral membrane sensor domain MASE1
LLAATLLAAVGFFLLGFGAIRLTPQGSPIAIMWPANAFALCLMLRYGRGWRDYSIMLAGTFVGDLFGNGLGAGSSMVQTVGYSLANALEMGVCLALVGKVRALRFANVRAAIVFALKAGLVPPLVGAVRASSAPDAPPPAL